MKILDYEKDFEDFWKDIIIKKGKIDLEQVKKELHDYHILLKEVPEVYMEVTGGRISKPNTRAFEVIGEFNEQNLNKEITKDDVKMMINDNNSLRELVDALIDYFDLED
ncbi:MAG: hypothetical protein WC346_06820 [Methanogenium sp.]|jgi:hypothetical protein